MASYNTVPAEDTRLQEAAKSWKLKKIVVVSAALSFSLDVRGLAVSYASARRMRADKGTKTGFTVWCNTSALSIL